MRTLLLLLVLAGCTTPREAPTYVYSCASGQTITMALPEPEVAVVTVDGVAHRMTHVVSASGARFAGDGLEWWTKGTGPTGEGMLSRLGPDGFGDEIVTTCREVAGPAAR